VIKRLKKNLVTYAPPIIIVKDMSVSSHNYKKMLFKQHMSHVMTLCY